MLEILARHSNGLVASWDNLFVNVWTGQGTLDDVKQVRDQHKIMVDKHPDGICVLTVIKSFSLTRPPEKKVLEAASKLFTEFREHVRASAQLVQGEGVTKVVTYSFLSVMAVASKGVPNKVFHCLEEAITWLSTAEDAGNRLADAPNDAIHALQELLQSPPAAPAE